MTTAARDAAWAAAAAAAAHAAVTIRELRSPADMRSAEALLTHVWSAPVPPLEASTLVALAHSGNYVCGAFARDDGPLLGVCVGFFGPPAERVLHSHIAGVLPEAAGRGIGAALKRQQRVWCLDAGVTTMTWTFDPVIARNAHFNLRRLGATVREYEVDLYGPMEDGRNAGVPTDRLLVAWDLTGPGSSVREPDGAVVLLRVGDDDEPALHAVPAAATAVLVQLPRDVERLRVERPATAARWRVSVRDALAERLCAGSWSVAGFSRDRGYLLTKGEQ